MSNNNGDDEIEMNDAMGDDGLDDELESALGDDDSFDDFGGQSTLGDLWRNNPLVKVGVIAGGAILIFGTIMLLGGSEDPVDQSYVPSGSNITSVPGVGNTSAAYKEAIEQVNEAEREEAERTGGSAIPVPTEGLSTRLTLPEEEEEREDPLARWRRLQEERLERELTEQQRFADQQRQNQFGQQGVSGQNGQFFDPNNPNSQNFAQAQADAAAGRTADIQVMADIMSQQMQVILESKGDIPLQHRSITLPGYFERKAAAEAAQRAELAQLEADFVAAGGTPAGASTSPAPSATQKVLFPAAEIAYSQLLTEANTDAPGPVLASISSGPLKGGRVLGSFEEQNELLTLTFNTLVLNGQSIPINAVALDPETTLPGLATDVDRRILKRILLPMAAAFVEAAAEAVSDSGTTTVTINNETVTEQSQDRDTDEEIASGVQEAGRELRDILDDIGDDTKVLIRIESGTPLGILFLEPVVISEEGI